MNQQEYAKYLGELIEDFEINVENDLAEQFYGYFQRFMPYGENVKKVFEPLQYKNELLERLLPIYQITASKTLKQYEEDVSPGYFCPESTDDYEKILVYGKQYIEYLKEFASFSEDEELLELLNNINNIQFFDEKPDIEDDYLNSHLYDCISDWGIDNIEEDELIYLLREAYYSINCDYYLSYYLQYPLLKNKPSTDFLMPYFKIWESGHYCMFDGNILKIFR